MKLGSIVIKDGKTYVKRGFGSDGLSTLEQIDFGFIKQDTVGELVGATSDGNGVWSGGTLLQRDYVSSKVNRTIWTDEYLPVIGTLGTDPCSYPLWNIAAIQVHYPEIYRNIIFSEYNKV